VNLQLRVVERTGFLSLFSNWSEYMASGKSRHGKGPVGVNGLEDELQATIRETQEGPYPEGSQKPPSTSKRPPVRSSEGQRKAS